MNKINTNGKSLDEMFDDFDEEDAVSGMFQARTHKRRQSKKHETDVKLFVRAQEISRDFQFTYTAARFEEAWLLDSLVEMAETLWISDVIRKVKAGKEASVYLCTPGPAAGSALIAAKIYRPRTLRNLKNDSMYRAGRTDIDLDGSRIKGDRAFKALKKRTSFGEELRHQSWVSYEYHTLHSLFEAGVDVPKPYAVSENAIMMDFVGERGGPAPALNEVHLSRAEAQTLFDRTVRNIATMLENNCIHGDLSAYNILYWQGSIRLIDFPQVVSPHSNREAKKIFIRDVQRVCDYFIRQGVDVNALDLANEIWDKRGYPPQEAEITE